MEKCGGNIGNDYFKIKLIEKIMYKTKVFLSDDINRFAKISNDYSPLHCDMNYSRKTMYGEPVIHGILGILECLKNYNKRILSLEAQFLRPILCNVPYKISEKEILDGNTKILRLKVKSTDETYIYNLKEKHCVSPSQNLSAKDTDIAEILEKHSFEGVYSAYIDDALCSSLLWSSWFIGMEVPGRQALYSKIELKLEQQNNIKTPFNYKVIIEEHHNKFNLLRMHFELYSQNKMFASGALEAFIRPKIPTTIYNKAMLPLEMQNKFECKTALVTGASRGFGAAIAQVLAAMGATVYINFKNSYTEALELQEIIKEQGGKANLLQGDISEIIEFNNSDIDILVCNAAPPALALALTLDSSTVNRIQSYVSKAFSYVLSPLSIFANSLNKKNGYCLVVSSGYMDSIEPEFPHYLCSKAAVEMIGIYAAKKYKNTKYLIVRPPKMLTDMSNSVMGNEFSTDPLKIAERTCFKLSESIKGDIQFLSFDSGE
jgi:NAD(P)-dependent dehydrogenase (short-subunit alcohol dehydrogenase family)